MFSVLLPIHSEACSPHLEECFLSLEKSDIEIPELIIIKDGLLGESLNKVINSFKNKFNSKVIEHEKSYGLPYSLNKGIQKASQPYIARMDSDDICAPSRFSLQLQMLKDEREMALIGSQINEISLSGEQLPTSRIVPCGLDEIKKFSKLRNPFNHPTVMFKKSCFIELGGYDERLKYAQDYELWMRFIFSGFKCKNIDKPLVFMRTSKDQIRRRSGVTYFLIELNLLKIFFAKKYLSYFEAIKFFIFRALPRLLGSKILYFLYRKFLRN